MITRIECAARDERDPLAAVRDRFALPDGVVYLDGNSLGALPHGVADRLAVTVGHEWGDDLITSWNAHAWADLPRSVGDRIARLIGAPAGSVVACDSTSINLHKAVSAALALTDRRVILSDTGNFPTDLYVMGSIADLRLVEPEHVLDAITPDVGVVALTHVGYSSGRRHDMEAVTGAAHAVGARMVWDLAHTAGAMPVDLGDADFALGCGYKYLNGGPGAPAFLYVRPDLVPEFRNPVTGWFGHAAPFDFSLEFVPSPGIDRVRVGTPSVLGLTALDAALDVFDGVDLDAVWSKSVALTELFVELVEARVPELTLASPRDPDRRGSHVSWTHPDGYAIVQAMIERGVIGDFRAPDVLRFGFAPLYLRHVDVFDAVETMADVVASGVYRESRFTVRNRVT